MLWLWLACCLSFAALPSEDGLPSQHPAKRPSRHAAFASQPGHRTCRDGPRPTNPSPSKAEPSANQTAPILIRTSDVHSCIPSTACSIGLMRPPTLRTSRLKAFRITASEESRSTATPARPPYLRPRLTSKEAKARFALCAREHGMISDHLLPKANDLRPACSISSIVSIGIHQNALCCENSSVRDPLKTRKQNASCLPCMWSTCMMAE